MSETFSARCLCGAVRFERAADLRGLLVSLQ